MRTIPDTRARCGSVIIIALITILFTAAALTLFIDRAATEIIVQGRQVRTEELRVQAHSAMQTAFAVISEFASLDGALHDPAQGWGDPLSLAGWDPELDGRVRVTFLDESSRFPLNVATRQPLVEYFRLLGIEERDAERLADNLLEWRGAIQPGSNPFAASEFDYARQPIPYSETGQRLRTFSELLLIRGFAEQFTDSAGIPNSRFQRIRDTATLEDVSQINLNTADELVLRAWLGLSDIQAARLRDERSRTRLPGEPAFLKTGEDIARVLGTTSFQQPGGTTIQILRVTAAVQDGSGEFPITAVVRTNAVTQGQDSGGAQRPRTGGNRTRNIPGTNFQLIQLTEGSGD